MFEISTQDTNESIKRIYEVPDKDTWKTTTSRIFKLNVVQFLSKKTKKKIVEFGAAQGHTTYFISPIASSVLSIDFEDKNCDLIKQRKCDNVEVKQIDLYDKSFTEFIERQNFDIAIIDAVHTYENVKKDIENAKLAGVKDFIFDDYGSFAGVKQAIDEFIEKMKEKDRVNVQVIGMPPGTSYPNTMFQTLADWEGIIVSID